MIKLQSYFRCFKRRKIKSGSVLLQLFENNFDFIDFLVPNSKHQSGKLNRLFDSKTIFVTYVKTVSQQQNSCQFRLLF